MDSINSQILVATPENITKSAELLQAGDLVAFPTETVYGLGANATDGKAIAKNL
jgi:L-threonylcarbamoyladenylate synthase